MVMLCDRGGIGWCDAGLGVGCRIGLVELGWRVVQCVAQVGQ